MVNTKVTLSGITLDNPIIPASGTFGYGYEFAELYDINCLGTFSFKGTTKDPRFGNPTPRIAECSSGMINAVGLQNPGVEKVISEELPKLKACFSKPVMANVSGFAIEDYAYTCQMLDSQMTCLTVIGGDTGQIGYFQLGGTAGDQYARQLNAGKIPPEIIQAAAQKKECPGVFSPGTAG